MSFKKQAALLLGAACLFLVFALSWKNLNRKGAMVQTPETPEFSGSMTWNKVLSNELKTLNIPASILKEENGELVIPFPDSASLRKSVEFSRQNNYLSLASYFQLKLAENTELQSDWALSGQYLYTYGVQMQDTLRRDFIMAEAIRSFDAVLNSDPKNMTATLYKGLALADKRESMMMGVPLLLSVVREDPDNLLANYTLGMLGIESGQYDKALLRFEKLISLQPANAEYCFQAGRACELIGNKEKALEYYGRSLELTENPQIRKELEAIIKQLK